jgi:hemerythrin-like domain-containing protein
LGPLAAGAALAAGGLITYRLTRPRRPTSDPFQDYLARFRLAHDALRRNLTHFMHLIDTEVPFDPAAFGAFVGLYAQFLVVHHEAEDRVLFPTLRRYGGLKSTDAAHLEKFTADHRLVNAAGETLRRLGEGLGSGGRAGLREVRRMSAELGALLDPHLSAEEELLTPGQLAEMIPPRAIGEIDGESGRLFSSARTIPLFFAHSLLPAEQRQVFAAAPWLFRKVILPLRDRRLFPRFAPFVLAPALEV